MWTVRNGYVELLAPQRSEPWFRARRRVTASNIEGVLGLSNFKTKEEVLSVILGGPEKSFDPESIRRMNLGTVMEDPLRNLHMKRYPGATIVEPSLCIGLRWYDIPFRDGKLSDYYPSQLTDPLHPNWWIGGSPDGKITFPDGSFRNLELKYTEKGYEALVERHEKGLTNPLGTRYTPGKTRAYIVEMEKVGLNVKTGALDYFPHIWRSHFFQMQTCASITRAPGTDYGVGTPKTYYTEVIPYDEKYWANLLYPELVQVIEFELKPRMSKDQLKEFTDEISEIIKICPKDQELKVNLV